jgi:multifunctional beta-oxidation protein
VLEVGSGWIAKVRWQRSGGYGFPVNKPLLPEDVAAKWKVITNFEDGRATYPTSTQDSFSAVQANFDNVAKENSTAAAKGGKPTIDVAKAQKAVFATASHEYTDRDVILYALGVNCKRTELSLVYENDEKFMALPTFGVIPAFYYQTANVSFSDFLPDFNPVCFALTDYGLVSELIKLNR